MEYSPLTSDTYEVEKIINCKNIGNKKYNLIKWLYSLKKEGFLISSSPFLQSLAPESRYYNLRYLSV